MGNRPRGRTVTTGGGSGHVGRTGGGSGGGHVGGGSFLGGGGSFSSGHSSSGGSHGGSSGGSGGGMFIPVGGGGSRSRGGGGCLPIIIVALLLIFGGGGFGVSQLAGNDSDYQDTINYGNSTYDGWYEGDSNTNDLDTEVSSLARDKFTKIKGNGQDTATVLVYMCGTDLESNSAMATKDINEMLNADVGGNLNVIVYTGGCKNWRNNVISSSCNQIWQVKNGQFNCLVKDAGANPMTDSSTLSSFIKWGAKNFPADRMDLILWDHGGGSITGYGYDQKYPYAGSMTLSGINSALRNSDVKFDFIGFDACLMGTAETGLVLSDYADYLFGSEELEPGIGWYYTNWLNAFAKNTSMPTLKIGKIIADDFVEKCASQCPGQTTTLSVTDLAELSQTLPPTLNAFASNASDKISNGEYKAVATARSGSQEFARSERLDQIDLAHFGKLMGTNEGTMLADTVMDAVKYNRTSKNIANAYGLSIYFPFSSLSKVDKISDTYADIGLDEEYTKCIRKFAKMQVGGQAVSGGGTVSPFDVLLGGGGSSQQSIGGQAMEQLIGQLFSGRFKDFKSIGLDELNESNTSFLTEEGLDAEEAVECINENRITAADLKWKKNDDGNKVIKLTEEQWDSVNTVDLEMFYDDGSGYIDLGLDNIFDFDEDGNMLPYLDKNWLSINGNVVAYYHTETLEKGDDRYVISGYVPVKLNGENARLILSFDNSNEEGYIAGVSYNYDDEVTETSAKNLAGLKEGDKVQFMCDYYSYGGQFKDSYPMSDVITISNPDAVTIRNIDVGGSEVKLVYKFTDIYGQEFWTPEISQ